MPGVLNRAKQIGLDVIVITDHDGITGTLEARELAPKYGIEIIAGHILAMFLVVFAQQLILVLLGQFVFGIACLRQPIGILSMIVVLAFLAASLGMLISAISPKEAQMIALSLIATFVLAAMGGA